MINLKTAAIVITLVSTNAMAGWLRTSIDLNDSKLESSICEEMVTFNYTDYVFDSYFCEENAKFSVRGIYKSSFHGKDYITKKKVLVTLSSLVCEADLKFILGGLAINYSGDVYRQKSKWYVDEVSNCKFESDKRVLKAEITDSNVKKIHKSTYNKLSNSIKNNLSATDLAFELGDGYYNYIKTDLYRVFDNSGKVIGFIEVSVLSYTEDDNIEEYYVRYNKKGERISAVGEYF